jgi:aspartokinase
MSSNSSPNHSHSPDVSSRIIDNETQEAERAESLNEKLVLTTISDDSSPQHEQSMKPEISPNIRNDDVQDSVKNLNEKVSPKVKDDDVQDYVKSLNEKLSAALLTINAKEDLVKQHTRVAEEAVAGIFFLFPVELK